MAKYEDLAAFAAVVRAGSFTRAAAQLGVTQSALSQTVRGLERRLDLKLLNRTTRSLSPTEAGERLFQAVGPRFADIEAELSVLGELRGKPAGFVRITATEHAARTLIWPKLDLWLTRYPDIDIEISRQSPCPSPVTKSTTRTRKIWQFRELMFSNRAFLAKMDGVPPGVSWHHEYV